MSRLAVLAAAVLAALAVAPAAHAATGPTYRQLANRACQAFFEKTSSLEPQRTLQHGRWPQARNRAVAQVRSAARLSLRTDDRLAAIAHPRGIDARWRRMIAADRAGARQLLATAAKVAATRTRIDAVVTMSEGYGAYQDARGPERTFDRLAKRLGLDGCLGLDPTADLGPDPHATPATRAAAAAFGAAAVRLRQAIVAATPAIRQRIHAISSPSCASVLDGAPQRAVEVALNLQLVQLVNAIVEPVTPALQQFEADLQAVATTDAGLVAGRRTLDRAVTALMQVPHAPDLCATLEAWKQRHWAPAAAPQLPDVAGAEIPDQAGRLVAFARRLRALGVPVAQIKLLTGDALFDGVEPAGGTPVFG